MTENCNKRYKHTKKEKKEKKRKKKKERSRFLHLERSFSCLMAVQDFSKVSTYDYQFEPLRTTCQ